MNDSTVFHDSVLCGVYSLTPLHCGTGQAMGAIDLPVAREAHTGFPVLPATSLKGVARDVFPEADDDARWLFGPRIGEVDPSRGPEAGALAFTEGQLLAYPIRSLNRPFFHATCRLALDRLARTLRALGTAPDLCERLGAVLDTAGADVLYVADKRWAGQTLVLEDLPYEKDEVVHLPALAQLGDEVATLVDPDDRVTGDRLAAGLVLLPDEEFCDLLARVVPVRARIQLTAGKTTGKWTDPSTGKEDSGNLWYEEHLPSDCLFTCLVGERRQRKASNADGGGASNRGPGAALAAFRKNATRVRTIQLGGNETVGHGVCSWRLYGKRGNDERRS